METITKPTEAQLYMLKIGNSAFTVGRVYAQLRLNGCPFDAETEKLKCKWFYEGHKMASSSQYIDSDGKLLKDKEPTEIEYGNRQ